MESRQEFDRLFGLFNRWNPTMATEWSDQVVSRGLLEDVIGLSRVYAAQNEAIHAACRHCRGDDAIVCPFDRRETDWVQSGGADSFPFASCGISGHVSLDVWGAFMFLLTVSEHASTCEGSFGHHPALEELFDGCFFAWQERLAARLGPVRSL